MFTRSEITAHMQATGKEPHAAVTFADYLAMLDAIESAAAATAAAEPAPEPIAVTAPTADGSSFTS